jgi:uncharacterized membrane protein
MRWRRRLQYAAACVLIVAYAGLSHYSNSVAGAHGLGVGGHLGGTLGQPAAALNLGAALALAPSVMVALVLAWRWAPPTLAVAVTLGLAALLYGFWPFLAQHFFVAYLVQESCVYGLLGLTFSRSLLPRQVAVCTQLADKVHGPLTPREVLYTRRVTAAWALFFFTVVTVSILLFLYAPLRTWSLFINFCVLPLVGAMFLAEYLVRRRVLPDIKRAGLLATVRVYLASPQ